MSMQPWIRSAPLGVNVSGFAVGRTSRNVAVHLHSTTRGISTTHTDRSAFPSRSIHSSPEKLEACIGRRRSMFACLSLPASIHLAYLAFLPSPSPPRPAPPHEARLASSQSCRIAAAMCAFTLVSYGGYPPLFSFMFADVTHFPSSHPPFNHLAWKDLGA